MASTRQSFLREALRGIALAREAHSLKALFAIERVWTRYPHWPQQLRTRALNLQESVLNSPRVAGLIYPQVSLPSGRVPERRWRQNVEIGLFPMSHVSIVEWYRSRGIEDIVMSYKDWAVAAIGDLGHSWTVWCSFYEALSHLETETDRLYAAERFAEFVAQQFHKDGRTLAQPSMASCAQVSITHTDTSGLLSESLRRPGFLGHHLITLATLLRHRALLDQQQFAAGLSQTKRMIDFQWCDRRFDIEIIYRDKVRAISDSEWEECLRTFLLNGRDNVHTLTLVDAAAALWDGADGVQRAQLWECLNQLVSTE